MTLQNLLRIGRLKEHTPTAAEVQRLLAAIERNLADTAVPGISDETRFDAAYKAVMQCALVAATPLRRIQDCRVCPDDRSIQSSLL